MDKKFSNMLTDAQQERLAILLEEMGEASQAIGKILRHGYESTNPDERDEKTNREALEKELGDVSFAIQMLADASDIDSRAISRRVEQKAKKIIPYLHHQHYMIMMAKERGGNRG